MDLHAAVGAPPLPLPAFRERILAALATMAVPVGLVAAVMLAWDVQATLPYTSGSETGYWLGVAGGSLMLGLLIYPLRKRFRFLGFLGPLKHWFRFHLVGGIAGPLLVLFHSTFRVGSFNAGIALGSMLLVVASGLVGRFLYRRIHKGLYGSRATSAELQKALDRQLEALAPVLARVPAVAGEIGRFSALAARQPAGLPARIWHFVTLGWSRRLAGRRIRRMLARYDADARRPGPGADGHRVRLAASADSTLRAYQRTAQFASYERLFSLWHVIHVPFLVMLLVTAIVHVVAVHAY